MNQITLRYIPDFVDKAIRQMSKKNKESINTTILYLLKKSLGINEKELKRKRDISKLAGTWSKDDEKEFLQNTSFFEEIDEDLWK
jgi:hypothetical protein